MKQFYNMLEDALLDVRTIFLGKLVSFDEKKKLATIQPISMIKEVGEAGILPAPIIDVPVLHNAQFKLKTTKQTCTVGGNQGCSESSCSCSTEKRDHLSYDLIKAGDICVCACSDRDITDSKSGTSSVPSLRHHDLSDSIMIGVL